MARRKQTKDTQSRVSPDPAVDDDTSAEGESPSDGEEGEGDHPDADSDDGEVLVGELIENDALVVDEEALAFVDDDDEAVVDVDADDSDRDLDETDLDVADLVDPEIKKPESSSRVQLIKRDPLSAYIAETKRYPLLSREEEHDLAKKVVEEGDTNAARRLIEANLRLVVKIAYEYRRAHRNLLDLIQEGNMGLMQAVRKYDPYRGVKLSSYAAWWIRAYILKFVLNNWRMVKIGTTQAQRKLFFNLRKEKERLEQLGFTPTTALLAENLDVNEQEVIEMEKRMSSPDASLDAPLGSGGDEEGTRTRMDYLHGGEGERPDTRVADSQFHELLRGKLEQFASTLKGRDAAIFRERWLTDSPLTLQELGDRYEISRERVRQLEKRMLDKLRKFLEDEFGTEVDIGALSGE